MQLNPVNNRYYILQDAEVKIKDKELANGNNRDNKTVEEEKLQINKLRSLETKQVKDSCSADKIPLERLN